MWRDLPVDDLPAGFGHSGKSVYSTRRGGTSPPLFIYQPFILESNQSDSFFRPVAGGPFLKDFLGLNFFP